MNTSQATEITGTSQKTTETNFSVLTANSVCLINIIIIIIAVVIIITNGLRIKFMG